MHGGDNSGASGCNDDETEERHQVANVGGEGGVLFE